MTQLFGCLFRRNEANSWREARSVTEESAGAPGRSTKRVARGKRQWQRLRRLFTVGERVEKRFLRSRVLRQTKTRKRSLEAGSWRSAKVRSEERRPEHGEKTLQEGALKFRTLWSPRTREEAPARETVEDATGRAEEAEEDRGRELPEVPVAAEGSPTGAEGGSGENSSGGEAEEARGSVAGSGAEEGTGARETVDELWGGDVEEAGSGSNSWCS